MPFPVVDGIPMGLRRRPAWGGMGPPEDPPPPAPRPPAPWISTSLTESRGEASDAERCPWGWCIPSSIFRCEAVTTVKKKKTPRGAPPPPTGGRIRWCWPFPRKAQGCNSPNKTLFGDVALGAFRCDTQSARKHRTEGSLQCPGPECLHNVRHARQKTLAAHRRPPAPDLRVPVIRNR